MQRNSFPRSPRGSVLIVAMLLAAIIAISLGSYLRLSSNSMKLANRTFYNNAAMNLAETGVEEALWSFNQVTDGVAASTAWNGWNTSDGVTATRTFSNFNFGANTTGVVKVYVDNYNPSGAAQPTAVAQTVITLPNGAATLTKMIEVTLRRRALFASGVVARSGISFSGSNASVDSWISDPDNNPATAAIPYSEDVRRDHGSIGTISVTSTISVQNADIWGTASVGGPSASFINVGSGGRVGPFGTASGTLDPNSVATDFAANLGTITAPATGTTIASVGATLGTAGTTTTVSAPSINGSVTIFGNVTLVLTAAPGTYAINLNGNDTITLAAGATLAIYTAGDVKLAGNGLLNNNAQPITFQLWGTSTSPVPQNIQIAGNGALKGVVYAPNSSLKINGNGDVMGAFVAGDVTVVGNAAIHYDESLTNWGGASPYGVMKWRELTTATDRASYASQLAF